MKADFNMEDDIQDFNFRLIVERILEHWKWFIIGIIVSLLFAYVYLQSSVPSYKANTTVLVKDDKKGGLLSELSAFSDLGLGTAMKSNVDNEVEILKSRTLVENTVNDLQLNLSILEKSNLKTIDKYKDAPIKVQLLNFESFQNNISLNLEYLQLSQNTFKLENHSDLNKINEKEFLNSERIYRFGEIINTPKGGLIISKSITYNDLKENQENSIIISINSIDSVVNGYLSRLEVESISKTSSVVSISVTDSNSKRAADFLNRLVKLYNNAATEDKNFISENTSRFIENRLILITKELDGVEKDVQGFKQTNNLTDIETESKYFVQGSKEVNNKIIEIEIQIGVVSSMIDFIKKSTTIDLLPTNIISREGDASSLINAYNQMVLERNRILKSSTADNPSILMLNQKIAYMKASISESLQRMQSSLNIQSSNLKQEELSLSSKLSKIPSQERVFRSIARQQAVKEELYLYLLKKREEIAISLTATVPNARVIDTAKTPLTPVSPKKGIIYFMALLIGLAIPFAIIYFKDLIDTKVKNRFDITDRFNIPFLGDVPHSNTPYEVTQSNNRSSSAEAMRIIRANLDFMLNQVPDGLAKTIFVTSTIAGEGKTFLSVNLASIFANSGKKVLLIGMDIRKPRLNSYLGLTQSKGLTDYLLTKDALISDYIIKYNGVAQLDLLLAGSVPPNPTELLINDKIGILFAKFKEEYDYIVVDTAPVSLVSDTLTIAKFADTFVYVIRARFADKRLLSIPEIMHREKKLPNIGLLLNDTDISKGFGFTYGYGYGSEQETLPWYKKILHTKK